MYKMSYCKVECLVIDSYTILVMNKVQAVTETSTRNKAVNSTRSGFLQN